MNSVTPNDVGRLVTPALMGDTPIVSLVGWLASAVPAAWLADAVPNIGTLLVDEASANVPFCSVASG